MQQLQNFSNWRGVRIVPSGRLRQVPLLGLIFAPCKLLFLITFLHSRWRPDTMLLALDTKLFINLHNTSMSMLVPLSKMDNPVNKKWFLAAADCYFVGTYHTCSVSLSPSPSPPISLSLSLSLSLVLLLP